MPQLRGDQLLAFVSWSPRYGWTLGHTHHLQPFFPKIQRWADMWEMRLRGLGVLCLVLAQPQEHSSENMLSPGLFLNFKHAETGHVVQHLKARPQVRVELGGGQGWG